MQTADTHPAATPIDLGAAIDAAVSAAHAGAALLQSYAHHRDDLVIDRKARNDLVSQADREAEEAILAVLQARILPPIIGFEHPLMWPFRHPLCRSVHFKFEFSGLSARLQKRPRSPLAQTLRGRPAM